MGQIDRYQALPGSSRSAADLGCDGASVSPSNQRDNYGGKHVTVWNSSENNERFSYEVDRDGNYIAGTVHYTDQAAENLWRQLFGSRW